MINKEKPSGKPGQAPFAPDPAHADHQLWVRGWMELPDGTRTESEWVNVSEVELAASYRKVLRKQLTIVGAERLMSAYGELSEAQRVVAAENFHRDGDLSGLQEELLAAGPGGEAAVAAFIRASSYVTSYGTQAAYALWGDEGEVLGVQTRVVFDPVIRWADRHDPQAQRPAATYTDLGWRPVMEWPGQDREAFARTFLAWVEQAELDDGVGLAPGDERGSGGAADGGAGGVE